MAEDIKIFFPEHGLTQIAKEGDTLLDVIRAAGLPIEAICSGRGTCGKCRVRAGGTEDLACKTLATDKMNVEILSAAIGQEILTESGGACVRPATSRTGKTAIAIDIGTTTVVVKTIDTGSGEELGIRAFTNPQRVYGGDVISRINNAMDDASELSEVIRTAIDRAIAEICTDAEKIVIAGNTTMAYLLLGLRCRSLGLAPFEPEYELKREYSYDEVFGPAPPAPHAKPFSKCPVLLYPYISAYVGGDIVSGLVNIERHFETDPTPSYILVDMGTNGEIAYRNGSRLITTSTAAGPALEGGNITCGMSGLPGAIYEAECDAKGNFSCRTISGAAPAGICGSGVISIMAALLNAGLVSETGAFDGIAEGQKELLITEDNGVRTVFTQKDVREFQLAKGAIRAGIDILIEEMGEMPQTLYLSGGFGQNINLDAAFRTGLIPRELDGRIKVSGNTSLGGCIDACMGVSMDTNLAAEEINLASHKNFNNKFMEMMLFQET